MDVSEAIRKRRSIRKYQARKVENDKIERVLEAGRLAPSAKNLQEWRFIVVRDDGRRRRLAEAAKGQTFVGEAPVVIAACATMTDYVMTCGQLTYPINLAIAVEHMVLQAVAEGLGTCWIGAFYEEEVKKVLNIPPEVRAVALLPLGYPDESPVSSPRKKMEEIIAFETWK
ncbi:MAG: nitroreductase family protein [Methanothrix sp.]|jgi:nitroreductase|uniref:Nitroreductase n=1 Tax=Methanothrix harundinacea TaxID=301375 RepID=A0A101FSZ3_9EURY|nr:MAG: nitroreductase [Methanosaeta sp. SDB]KUK43905.1 MAG: Nitroreductase [Methanothrix harundinacea]MDD2637613.1 nitroreductase family protein [Methanothrix sp.]MDI9399107.1 nitroreductase family protein [Euryarchaeota archaeon]KUK96427.1 MAG: Nitroreductase [Methanothrix harundinacea]